MMALNQNLELIVIVLNSLKYKYCVIVLNILKYKYCVIVLNILKNKYCVNKSSDMSRDHFAKNRKLLTNWWPV